MLDFQKIQIFIFTIGYLVIIFEHFLKVHKTAASLLVATLCWGVYVIGSGLPIDQALFHLNHHLSDTSQIVFFLIGAMTIVEMINEYHGFDIITNKLQNSSKAKMLWLFGFTSFFLSAILDNLTTTIAMISVIRKIMVKREDRWVFGSLVVIAANAGGAWTPIGDVTTTMLWMGGQVTSLAVIQSLFLPSFISLFITIALFVLFFRGKGEPFETIPTDNVHAFPNCKRVFFLGIGMLIFVPIFKTVTHLPPYMGMLLSLGIVWIFTDLLQHKNADAEHLKITGIMGKIDLSSALFFMGILLSIGSLETAGILEMITQFMGEYIHDERLIAATVGITSAIVDNVPLVAACMSMYKMAIYPVDSPFWQMIAYCSGTGGSILVIGSAAGVAFMGMERVNFFWYLKKISLIALISYLIGLGAYIALYA